jgi:hypothetical protein
LPDTHQPTSPRRLAANRANAQHSTGPRTPEGKARSARNAYKHGFTASTFSVVRLEDLDEVDRLKQDLVHDFQPVNSQEMFALERIAVAQQALLRAARLEAGLFTNALDEALDQRDEPMVLLDPDLTHDLEVTRQQNRNYILAFGFHRMAQRSNTWLLFLRYQAQTERHYRRALEEFERLKNLRPELPNEPISEPQPEETEPGSPPGETNQTNPSAPQPPAPVLPPPAAFAPFTAPPSFGLNPRHRAGTAAAPCRVPGSRAPAGVAAGIR